MTGKRTHQPRPNLSMALAAATTLALFWPGAGFAAQKAFATPDAAASALIDAVRANDTKAIVAILGDQAGPLVSSGDTVQDNNARAGFAKDYDTKHSLAPDGDNEMQLVVGSNDWPLPIPIVKQGAAWSFDASQGVQQLIDRRIGRNELLTIKTLLSIGGAEQDYFQRQNDATGKGFYAQHILSSDGASDGLYWPATNGNPESPLGPLVDAAQDEGYPDSRADDGTPLPYHGYFFHVLTAQGDNAEGGAKSYMQGDAMTGGYAFVAWPAQYGNSGVVTFLLGPDDIVYQRDLGPDTGKLAPAMKTFDPDLGWARVDVKD
jgi:hypothetical protein